MRSKRHGIRELSLASAEYQMSQQKCSGTPRLVLRKKNILKQKQVKKKENNKNAK